MQINSLNGSNESNGSGPDQSAGTTTTPMAGKTLKRRNFKKLQLSPASNTGLNKIGGSNSLSNNDHEYEQKPVKRQSTTSQTSAAQTQRQRNQPFTQSHRPGPEENIESQLASLELGVPFKLDLRQEDLEMMADLGHGNGGQVTRVLHTPTQTVMAKKVIHIEAKPAVRKQIVRELHIMHDCESEHIVSYYGAFASESNVIMCMEYMDCGSLDRIVKIQGSIDERVIAKITNAVVEGLTYLYSNHRIIHRDVKPSNVLVNSNGEIKLCDFGVSGELINSTADTFVGTSTYMSPERIQGAPYSVKSDVWSLGISVLELAIGRFPWNNTDMDAIPVGILDLLQRIVNEPPPELPQEGNFTQEFRDFIAKCLLKEAERPSPRDLLQHPFLLRAKQDHISLKDWAAPFEIK